MKRESTKTLKVADSHFKRVSSCRNCLSPVSLVSGRVPDGRVIVVGVGLSPAPRRRGVPPSAA